MSKIDILNKLINDMDKEIKELNDYIITKSNLIDSLKNKLDEINSTLIKEEEIQNENTKKRDQLIELKSEVNINYNQINQGVDTLVEILKNKTNL
jgi:predicted RNase H-like nuclease (RuvC/YqgF family)